MPCVKCLQKPGYHSFVKVGYWNSTGLFYTAPAKTEDFNEDGTKLLNIKIHVLEDTATKPWIWILDCAHMGLKHYTEFSFNIGLLQLLSEDKQLQGVWIINPNIWFRTTVGALKLFSSSPVLQNIHYIEGSNLDMSIGLAALGLEPKHVEKLLELSNQTI